MFLCQHRFRYRPGLSGRVLVSGLQVLSYPGLGLVSNAGLVTGLPLQMALVSGLESESGLEFESGVEQASVFESGVAPVPGLAWG